MSDAYEPVQSVTHVAYALTKSHPPIIRLAAKGTVRTLGWGEKGQLDPRKYVTTPIDGIWDFDFIGIPPSGISPQVVTAISAEVSGYEVPSWFRGVRVHSSTNTLEKTSGPVVEILANWVPMPW